MRLIISLNLGALPRTRYKVKIRRKRRVFCPCIRRVNLVKVFSSLNDIHHSGIDSIVSSSELYLVKYIDMAG